MDEQKLKGLMGLCVRARQAIFGEDACLRAIREEKAELLLLDNGISKSNGRKYETLGKLKDVPVIRLRSGLLEESTGRPGRAMAVRGGSLAEEILNCLQASQPETDA